MENNILSLNPTTQARTFYANALRCIGQSLEAMELKAVEVKTHGDSYVVQAWNKGTSTAMDMELFCGPEDLKNREIEGKKKRKALAGPPNLLSLSQVLRLAGNYVDRIRGRLIRVSWQDQSDRIQAITVQYEPCRLENKTHGDSQMITIEELCIHVYKQRKKIAVAPDKNGYRPFVNVSHGNGA